MNDNNNKSYEIFDDDDDDDEAIDNKKYNHNNDFYRLTPLNESFLTNPDDIDSLQQNSFDDNYIEDSFYGNVGENDNNNNNNDNNNNDNDNDYDDDDNNNNDDDISDKDSIFSLLDGYDDDDDDRNREMTQQQQKQSDKFVILYHYILKINKNIRIYNINVVLYRKTADILEKHFQSVFESISQCFLQNTRIIIIYKKNSIKNKVYVNLKPIINFSIIFYTFYKAFILAKINEIKNYLRNIEKNMIMHSFLIIGLRYYLKDLLNLSEQKKYYENILHYYSNNDLDLALDKIRNKFDKLLSFIIETRTSLLLEYI